MDLKETLAISGHSGLFKFISQGRNGIVVEAFTDKKRTFVPATTKVSTLEDIAIFTNDKEVPLKDVLKNIFEKEKGGKTIDPKTASPEDLKKYMEEILPDYDKERVYVSDLKKLFSWYNILQEMGLLKFDEKEEPAEQAVAEEAKTEPAEDAAKKTEKTTKTKAKSSESKSGSAAKSKESRSPKKEKSSGKK